MTHLKTLGTLTRSLVLAAAAFAFHSGNASAADYADPQALARAFLTPALPSATPASRSQAYTSSPDVQVLTQHVLTGAPLAHTARQATAGRYSRAADAQHGDRHLDAQERVRSAILGKHV